VIRAKGRYRNRTLELEQPLPIAEGTDVEIDIHVGEERENAEDDGWRELGMSGLEQEWDNAEDAIHDDWKKLDGVSRRRCGDCPISA
jgi:hypothetical protein